MKIGEILRQLADAIEADNADGLTSSPGELMVSPLQQTHELLKKEAGVENNVDVFAADDPKELARLAGVQQPAAQAPVINQTIVINTGQSGQETPSVQTTETVAEAEPVKAPKRMSYKDNYNTISEDNDECINDVGTAYDKLKEEFEALNSNKGKK